MLIAQGDQRPGRAIFPKIAHLSYLLIASSLYTFSSLLFFLLFLKLSTLCCFC